MNFQLCETLVRINSVCQDAPLRMERIGCEIVVVTGESDHRLDLLHNTVKKYSNLFKMVVSEPS